MPGHKIPSMGEVGSSLQCRHCELLLRDAVQTEDGDRVCQSCYDEIQRKHEHRCTECGILAMPGSKVFADVAVRKVILAMEVTCKYHEHGCPWCGKLQHFEDHCEKCKYKPATCPNKGCGVQLPLSKLDQHIDACLFRLAPCTYCQELVQVNQQKEHYGGCPKYPVKCAQCQDAVARSELANHQMNSCPIEECNVCHELVMRETTCDIPYDVLIPPPKAGASATHPGQKSESSQQPHLADPRVVHRHIQALGLESNKLKADVANSLRKIEELNSAERTQLTSTVDMTSMRSENEDFLRRLVAVEGSIEAWKGERAEQRWAADKAGIIDSLQKKLEELYSMSAEQNKAMAQKDRKIEELQRAVDSVRGSSRDNKQSIMQLQLARQAEKPGYYASGDSEGFDRYVALEKKVEELERQSSLLKVHVSELELQLQASLASTHNGCFLWRIPDVARRRRDAIEERITSIYSPPFYTGRNGYKMCVRAYLNGDGSGYRTHLSLFFVLMKGEYDPLLKWPFENKVSLILVDQDHRKHVVQTFKPTPESNSFKRPTSDMNVASGCPQFAKLSVLDDESYVKADVLYIKCIVDTSKIFHP